MTEMQNVLIGIDIGGTNVRMGAISLEGGVLKKYQYSIEGEEKGTLMLEKLVFRLQRFVQEEVGDHLRIRVGIGIPGPIDLKKGIIVESPNLPGLKGFPLREFFQERISFPTAFENDANAFALGEGWVGAAKGSTHYCGITLGTGVGGGIIIGGKILHGMDGLAGEVGHMVIDPEGPRCGCGGRGCLEIYASGKGIRRMALEFIHQGRGKGILRESGEDPERINSETIFKAAQTGDLEGQEIFHRMGRSLGLGLVNLLHLFNPEKIVIGGKVSEAWNFFFGSLLKTIQERAMEGPRKRVQIVKALCGDDAGMLGAAYTALLQFP